MPRRRSWRRPRLCLKLQGGGLGAFRTAAKVVRKGGTIQVTGVYGMNYNLFPFGELSVRNINVKMGQAPVIHFMPELYRQLREGVVDPRDIITHRWSLSEAERECEKSLDAVRPFGLYQGFSQRLPTLPVDRSTVRFQVRLRHFALSGWFQPARAFSAGNKAAAIPPFSPKDKPLRRRGISCNGS